MKEVGHSNTEQTKQTKKKIQRETPEKSDTIFNIYN